MRDTRREIRDDVGDELADAMDEADQALRREGVGLAADDAARPALRAVGP